MTRKNAGYSLIEVMVVTGILGILMLVLMTLFDFASNEYYGIRQRLEAEEIGARLEYTLRLVFGQAVDIQFGAPSSNIASGTNLGTTPGRVIGLAVAGDPLTQSITFDRISSSSDWVTVAAFLRETGTASVASGVQRGTPRQTALFYRRAQPTATPQRSAMLFLDYGPAPGAAAAAMAPTWDDEAFDRITYFKVTKHKHAVVDQTVSLDFVVRIRFFRQTMGAMNLSWCPALDMGVTGGCTTKGRWSDIERQFSITLRNNIVRVSTDVMASAPSAGNITERVMGSLYFFLPVIPANF